MAESSYTLIRDTKSGEMARIDFKWKIEKRRIRHFSINLSILEEERSVDVYRVDTEHGFVHEHRLWKTKEPERLNMDYNKAFIEKKNEVLQNYERWILLFKNKQGENYG